MDLNADIAEFDAVRGVRDQEPFYRYITSANIACGGHAGTAETMREAIELCALRRVAPGAHPSYEDRPGFGRGEYPTSPSLVRRLIYMQVKALIEVGASIGVSIGHVKAHGRLYHDISTREDLALAAVLAMRDLPYGMRLFGPPDGILALIAHDAGIPFAAEGFTDRAYGPDGLLLPRTHPDAILHNPDAAAEQALELARSARFQTLCIHADHPDSLERLKRIHHHLTSNGVILGPT